MNLKIIVVLMTIILTLTACSQDPPSEAIDSEIASLRTEVDQLKMETQSKSQEIQELKKSIQMIRFSAMSRMSSYSETFMNLEYQYLIHTDYEIVDDWYVIDSDDFRIELLDYDTAKEVRFYSLRMESDQGPMLMHMDNDPNDGWVYSSEDIGEFINQQSAVRSGGISFVAYFVIYAEVVLEDDTVIKTPKLPIYYKHI